MRQGRNCNTHPNYLWMLKYIPIPFLLLGFLIGCESTSEPTSQKQQLRIYNSSSYDIQDLTVIFPKDRVHFGQILPNTTSEYFDFPDGVYRYAAYRIEVEDKVTEQPVIDWVGETPMEGLSITYSIDIFPEAPNLQVVKLVDVKKDK